MTDKIKYNIPQIALEMAKAGIVVHVSEFMDARDYGRFYPIPPAYILNPESAPEGALPCYWMDKQ